MMALREAAEVLGAVLSPPTADARFVQVSNDTRSLAPGALYVALKGERFDGHDFAAAAQAAGAVAALVERPLPERPLFAQIRVPDTHQALGALAAHWRSRLSLPLIGVTGSNGKTTTTQMIGAILAQALGSEQGQARSFATRGNRNNAIGVPLMLLELRAWHRAAVLELGMNHVGEIAQLAAWAQPTVGLVNNAQREHQEFLDSVEATARENGAVISRLPPDGIAVFPAADPCAPIWRALAGTRRVLDFSLSGPAAVQARVQLEDAACRLEIQAPQGRVDLRLEIAGLHNAHNALAAASACLAVGIGLEDIAAGLAAFRPVGGRGTRLQTPDGIRLIDDSYNANPDSVRAAIDLLAQQPGTRILVLGDMAEVGVQGPQFHAEVGAHARARGLDGLLALGPQSAATVTAFGAGARHFASLEALVAALRMQCAAGPQASGDPASASCSVLVKASRSMRMERVVAALMEKNVQTDLPTQGPQPGELRRHA